MARATVIICSFNIAIVICVFHNLYSYPYQDSHYVVSYTPDEIRNMEESSRIRVESEPVKLIQMVREIKNHFNEKDVIRLLQSLKQKLTNELVEVLRVVKAGANTTLQHEAVQHWRKQKLEEAKRLKRGKSSNSTILPEEAGILTRAMESNWAELLDEIGLWIPVSIINNEHNDKPEGEDDFDDKILAGRRLPPECNVELNTDYGGQAVKWGLTHHKESAYECCQACLDHARNAKPNEVKCNIWVYCPEEEGCHSPDKYEHKLQECWLKYAEKPKVNFKDMYSEDYRNRHPNAPMFVPWVSGVVSS
ncbi:hypothetical protein CTI12_AA303140 [Artemisia annua]|uniref:Uncharacterized protein n=1 Tax=Artemisia annua TaxID=35608 RepID=A0A2U1MD48_ARTAN|nr:hypothetical protein CTI12_AA303140 [Artemisia annua]